MPFMGMGFLWTCMLSRHLNVLSAGEKESSAHWEFVRECPLIGIPANAGIQRCGKFQDSGFRRYGEKRWKTYSRTTPACGGTHDCPLEIGVDMR